jgi:non-specific serine/threonine protein kinase
MNDPERAAMARAELDRIVQELAGAVGLGGRDRQAGSDAERARVNATRAIRATLRRVEEHDPRLGRLLARSIRTGTFCIYEPDPDQPIDWTVES